MTLDANECAEARKKALQLLEYSDRSKKGLSDRLGQAGFSQAAVEDAVAYVSSYGYLNDERFAENFIRSRLGQVSRRKLMADLGQKGIDAATAARAWDEVSQEEPHDERGLIRRTVLRRCGSSVPTDPAGLRRLYGYLARRGFEYEDIRAVVEDLSWLGEEAEDLEL